VQTLAVLSKLYKWARRAGHVDCANPVQGVERPRTTSTVDYLDRAEVGRLIAKAEELARADGADWEARTRYPMAVAAIYTGMRKGELFGLRWIDVHLDAGRIDVARSYRLAPKSGQARHLPIHPELARVLREWRPVCAPTDENLVFPTHGGGKRGRWHMGEEQDMLGIAELFAAAECHEPADGKPWHLLRHSFASHAVMSGTSLYEVQRLLGHASPAMTQRYAHLAPDHLAGAVARLSFSIPAPTGMVDFGEEKRKRAR
jgi:integrase